MSKKMDSKRKKERSRNYSPREIGIPTIFTPVPPHEKALIAEQSLRRFRTSVAKTPSKSDMSSFQESTAADSKQIADPHVLPRMALIRVYFMQNLFTTFELATDRSLQTLLRIVLNAISKEIRNEFSFYVFASPYDVIWKRPRCEVMKTPPSDNIFRQILVPSQMNLTLSELFLETKTDGLELMNIYLFVKNMTDENGSVDGMQSRKSWKYQQVIN